MARKKSKPSTPEDIVAEDLRRKQKRDFNIELGMSLQEYFRGQAGSYLLSNWEQHMAITMKDGYIGKHQKPHPDAGKYLVDNFYDFSVTRGFILGIEWVLEDIQAKINRAKKLRTERSKEEKEESET
jgi:hypothetical protein